MSNNDQDKGSLAESEGPPPDDEEQDIEAAENEEAIHERLHREKHHHHKIWTQNREAGGHKMHKHHHHHHHHHHQPHGHIKEFIKPDPTVRRARLPGSSQATVHIVQPPSKAQSPRPVATAVDEEQLQKRLMESVSEKKQPKSQSASVQQPADESRSATTTTTATATATTSRLTDAKTRSTPMPTTAAASTTLENKSDSSSSGSSSSYSSSSREGQHSHLLRGADKSSSPPPAAIIIPPNVAKSLSSRRLPVASAPSQRPESPSLSSSTSDSNVSRSPESQGSVITREQLEYGSLLRSNEVQVLYRSPESVRARSIASKTIKGHLMKHQPAPDKSQNKQQDS